MDGKQVGAGSPTIAFEDTAATFTLAGDYGKYPSFVGVLDEVAVYDHALGQSRIEARARFAGALAP